MKSAAASLFDGSVRLEAVRFQDPAHRAIHRGEKVSGAPSEYRYFAACFHAEKPCQRVKRDVQFSGTRGLEQPESYISVTGKERR